MYAQDMAGLDTAAWKKAPCRWQSAFVAESYCSIFSIGASGAFFLTLSMPFRQLALAL